MKNKHTWNFKKYFRKGAFGWKGTTLATKRLKEAVSEIKKVNKTDPFLAGDGCIILMESPRTGHQTNHSSFWLTVNNEYFTEGFDKKQIVKFGQKNVILMKFKNINKRAVRHCEYLEGLKNPIIEALKYQECSQRKGVNTKAEVGEIFGVSRARVVQYMNLLKLPNPIIDFMLHHRGNKRVCKFFTERRLRPLTQIEDKMQCLETFNSLVAEKIFI